MAVSKPIILVVDDDKTVLDSIGNQLRGAFGRSFRYEPATSPEEAWEILDEAAVAGDTIGCLVSDWLMPTQHGDVYLSQVHAKYPHIPKIMLSGYADDESVARAQQQAELLAYLSKPWDPEELLGLIGQAAKLSPTPAA